MDQVLQDQQAYEQEYEQYVQQLDEEMAGEEFDAAIDIGEEHMMDSDAQNASTVVSQGQP